MLRADAGAAADEPDHGTGGPAVSRSPDWPAEDQAGAARDQAAPQAPLAGSGPSAGTRTAPQQDHDARAAASSLAGISQVRVAASRLAAAGRPVSRRALRSEGIKGSNQALNALAGHISCPDQTRRAALKLHRKFSQPAGQQAGNRTAGNRGAKARQAGQGSGQPCDVPLDAPAAREVALGQVVRYPGMCRGPAGQFSGRRPEAHAGR